MHTQELPIIKVFRRKRALIAQSLNAAATCLFAYVSKVFFLVIYHTMSYVFMCFMLYLSYLV